jgi:hypothetical protein
MNYVLWFSAIDFGRDKTLPWLHGNQMLSGVKKIIFGSKVRKWLRLRKKVFPQKKKKNEEALL